VAAVFGSRYTDRRKPHSQQNPVEDKSVPPEGDALKDDLKQPEITAEGGWVDNGFSK